MERIGLGEGGTLIEISRRRRLHQSGAPRLDLTGREKRLHIALRWTYEADFLPALPRREPGQLRLIEGFLIQPSGAERREGN
jgi:hypothetical protein